MQHGYLEPLELQTSTAYTLSLTPHGHLRFEPQDKESESDLATAFNLSSGRGLLQLGADEKIRGEMHPILVWWRDFSHLYINCVCQHTSSSVESALVPNIPEPTTDDLTALVLSAPMMQGAEYLTNDVLLKLWLELDAAFTLAYIETGADLQAFLKNLNPAWNLVGRVHFNLAENSRDPEFPFAFMATYTTGLSGNAAAKHVPLGQALREYAGTANRNKMLSLLVPVQRAAAVHGWLKAMVTKGEIFHPLKWTADKASRFLNSVPDLEKAGIVVRMPATWKSGRPPRPQVSATVGARPPSGFGVDALLDFDMDVTLDGSPLTEDELASLLAGTQSLVLLRGKWVEVDPIRLENALERLRDAQAIAQSEGLTFAQAVRLLSGVSVSENIATDSGADWSVINSGEWLSKTLTSLRTTDGLVADPGPALKGELRPYQKAGVQWLNLLTNLGLGACLADDMGLGKTIQILSLLLIRKTEKRTQRPNLLIVPASLLSNWADEIARFAPDLKIAILHSSEMRPNDMTKLGKDGYAGLDLVITSYGSLLRMADLADASWGLVILDEAQAIKNPATKQTIAAKKLKSQARIALTGTPVENQLGDLWSIFDFINPGLLGSVKEFTKYSKTILDRPHNPYGDLRNLISPYILRRMKTDKSIISDLPDKTELHAYCSMSRKQVALYTQTVSELAEALKEADGIQRKGLVLASIMRLKQICNHPSQWLGDNSWEESESGKWARLREIAEMVAARQEKMLIFTQFREITDPLSAFLREVFGKPGLILHGGTPVKSRKTLVKLFQEDENVPFFILSLKAGGSGLTLTEASHVVHFDRWWNPAVENQATDRAFRIGQKRNVLVHKFVCSGTVEEKIDTMIEAKKNLSQDLLSGKAEMNLTEMQDEDILRMVSLDLNSALKE
jgi:SNF2 family DNA or RNA helicase